MSGLLTPFVDFTTGTDTGAATTDAIAPHSDGEKLNQAVLRRPAENLRQRTEVLRAAGEDVAYLQQADRGLVLAGPGRVTWPGSTTAAATGIAVLTDVLYLVPLLTPGAAQVAPVPPVASSYGTLKLKRATGASDAILVSSLRRSYAGGDRINITVVPGAVFACTLVDEIAPAYDRTIQITATPATTLLTVITALNALTADAPATQLVSAALTGGALNADLVLDTQARVFISGNYDGEGHALTPANLASFFSTYTTDAYLAEGDSLCVQFAMLTDTASTGGRRQALPENANTAVTPAMFFNSRVHPERLVGALPVCKVVNGDLVFATGITVTAGSTAATIGTPGYAGGPAWADGTTNPATSVEAQLDKIVTDLAGATGTAKIQGTALGAELAVGTLAAQLEAIVKRVLGWVTIGDGTTVVGDFNTADYANANLLLAAAIATLPAAGGRILLKRGVALSGFGGTTTVLPANKTLEIFGDHGETPLTSPQITFTTGEGFVTGVTSKLILRNLHLRHTAPAGATAVSIAAATSAVEIYDCLLESTASASTGSDLALVQGTAVTALRLERVRFNTTQLPSTLGEGAIGVKVTAAANQVFLRNLACAASAGAAPSFIDIADVQNDVVLENITYDGVGGAVLSAGPGTGPVGIRLGSSDNITNTRNRRITNYTAKGGRSLHLAGAANGCAHLTVENMQDYTFDGMSCASTYSTVGGYPVVFRACRFANIQVFEGVHTDLQFLDCTFTGMTTQIGIAASSVLLVAFKRCAFRGQAAAFVRIEATLGEVLVEECRFTGFGDTAAPLAMFTLSIGAVTAARFLRNTVLGFQAGTYAGVDSTNPPKIFRVLASQYDLLECSENIVTSAMRNTGGTTIAAAYLLAVDSTNGSPSIVPSGVLRMHDNQLGVGETGASANSVLLLSTVNTSPEAIDLCRNTWWVEWSVDAGTPQWRMAGVSVTYPAAYTGGGPGFVFDDNHVRIENTSLATITQNLIHVDAAGAPVFGLLSFERNHIHLTTAQYWQGGVGVPGVLVTDAVFASWMVVGNSTFIGTGNPPGTAYFSIRQNDALYGNAGVPTHAAFPAAATVWPSNSFVYRGVL